MLILQPDPRVMITLRLFPKGARSVVLGATWGVALLLFILSLLSPDLVGWGFIALSAAVPVLFVVLFFERGIEHPPRSEEVAAVLEKDAQGKRVNVAPLLPDELTHALPFLRSPSVERILRALLDTAKGKAILARLGIPVQQAHDILSELTPDDAEASRNRLVQALDASLKHAQKRGHETVRFADAVIGFIEASEVFQKFLFDRDILPEDLDLVAHWEDEREHRLTAQEIFWSRENLLAVRPFGRAWSFGYTPTLDRFSLELTEAISRPERNPHAVMRLREVTVLERGLAKSSSANALLVAEPGSGAKDIPALFARRVATGASHPLLNYRRVVAVDFGAAVAGLETVGAIEERIRKMLSEAAKAGGVIMFVENFHALVDPEFGVTPVDLTATFLPFLEGERIQLVGTTTFEGLHGSIEKRAELSQLFTHIPVHEPDVKEATEILLAAVPAFEAKHQIYIPYATIKATVAFADKTIQDTPFPKKAFDVLEDALIDVSQRGEKMLTAAHVAEVIAQRTKVPVGAITEEEREKLLELEDIIHERIVDQKEAVALISDALRRARAGVTPAGSTRPIGTFLFMGPTGVGKTETAKALAEVYFGSDERMVRVDMSEFQGVDALARLVGSSTTGQEGWFVNAIRDNPFTLVLLDEFEKAHRKVLDLFLQVFDEGKMKDGWGRGVTFTHTIIIATSNAGAEFIRQYLKGGKDPEGLSDALCEEVLQRGLFRPELLNRFDAAVVFKPLGLPEVKEIARRMLRRFSQSIEKEKGIMITVTDEALGQIIEEGFNQEFGARELRRVMQDTIETITAKKLIAEEVKRGDTLTITVADLADV